MNPKQYLNGKFVNVEIFENNSTVKIMQINKMKGDSNYFSRKRGGEKKPICHFDLDLEFKVKLANHTSQCS